MKQLRNNAILCNGKYKIERVLGQGGFGITYLAKQKVSVAGALGTIDAEIEVTIKEFFMKELCNRDEASSMVTVPSTGSADLVEKFRQKFIKEAKNISKLTHPYIIKVLDVFEENGTAYYVMEYIDGGSLSDLIEKKGSLSEDETLKYTRQIASALQYIHAHNMNHLDVKPGNVLLRKNGDVVLIDFGMSKNYDVAGEQTTSSPVGVSVGYAPIEQSRVGGLGMFSPETDIYSLGATMFKMLTGQTPPEATAVFDEGLPELPQEISEQTKRVIERAMQPRRKERYHTIVDFLDALGDEPYSTLSVEPILEKTVTSEKISLKEETIFCSKTNPVTTLDDSMKEVDLGLSVNWASNNLRLADARIDNSLIGWGNVDGRLKSQTVEEYIGDIDIDDIAGTCYDIVSSNLGKGWSMPTEKQWQELLTKCTLSYNFNKCGFDVNGPNGNSIFLPLGGFRTGDNVGSKSYGFYWTSCRGINSNMAKYVSLSKNWKETKETYVYYGMFIRPVRRRL